MAESRRRGSFAEKVLARQRRRKLALFAIAVLAGISLIHDFFIQSFWVESESMTPGIVKGNALLASPLPFGPDTIFGKLPGFSEPKRGAIIVYKKLRLPNRTIAEKAVDGLVGFFSLEKLSFTKFGITARGEGFSISRVIAIPGDTVRMAGGRFEVKPRGSSSFMDEFSASGRAYELSPAPTDRGSGGPFGSSMPETLLNSGEYFVAGDNRTLPSGSMLVGPIRAAAIYDRVILRYWPLKVIGRP